MIGGNQAFSAQQLFQAAFTHYQAGNLPEATMICRQMMETFPRLSDAWHLMGVIDNQSGNYKSAVKHLKRAVKLKNDVAFFHANLGLALQNAGDLLDAAAAYRRAITLDPNLAEAHMNFGNVLKDQGRFDEAIDKFKRALEINPADPHVYYNMGIALQKRGDVEAAIESYRQAIALNPYLAPVYTNLGTLLKDIGHYPEAVEAFNKGIALDPNIPETYNNLGIALTELKQHDLAIEQFQKSLALKPDNDEAHYNLGFAYRGAKKLMEAIQSYRRALELNPNNVHAVGELVHQLRHACIWGEETDALEKRFIEMIGRKREGLSPFVALTLQTTPAEQLACAKIFSRKFAVSDKAQFRHSKDRGHDKIRIGYLSADYHQHATAYLMAELFERHDKSRFETYAYSYGPDDGSDLRKRLVKSFDSFVDIRELPHKEAAQRIYDDSIDILVDLKGYTGDTRSNLCAMRPAPVQVNYIGYPGTMGADFMDYIIADPVIAPMEHQPFFAEKIVQLPDCYQPNDTHREIFPETPTRAECGLPEKGFVFCSFNNTYKITPAIFDIWMRLLKQVEGSVLWTFEGNALAGENLRREAANRGVDPARLITAPGMLLDKHLARHKLGDLFLDTTPVNAHTTASDALWAGLPLVTCLGDSFVARVAASLLKAAELPELVTQNLAEYEALALSLAQDPVRLQGIKEKLQKNLLNVPLFDIARFVPQLESAYAKMWQKWQAGEKPAGFTVERQG